MCQERLVFVKLNLLYQHLPLRIHVNVTNLLSEEPVVEHTQMLHVWNIYLKNTINLRQM